MSNELRLTPEESTKLTELTESLPSEHNKHPPTRILPHRFLKHDIADLQACDPPYFCHRLTTLLRVSDGPLSEARILCKDEDSKTRYVLQRIDNHLVNVAQRIAEQLTGNDDEVATWQRKYSSLLGAVAKHSPAISMDELCKAADDENLLRLAFTPPEEVVEVMIIAVRKLMNVDPIGTGRFIEIMLEGGSALHWASGLAETFGESPSSQSQQTGNAYRSLYPKLETAIEHIRQCPTLLPEPIFRPAWGTAAELGIQFESNFRNCAKSKQKEFSTGRPLNIVRIKGQ